MNAPSITLAQVLPAWMQAKEDERKATEHRRSLDRMIQSLLPTKDEGSVSKEEGNYKVTVQYKLDRKLDVDRLRNEWNAIPANCQQAIKWKAELSTTEFRKLDEQAARALSSFITTKPASPSVSVEFREES